MHPIDRIRVMQENHDRFSFGSSEEYREALPRALSDLALGIAFMAATAEFCTDDTLKAIFHRTEALLAAGRTIARSALRERAIGASGTAHMGATDA